MFGIDAITAAMLTGAAVCLIVYGLAFGDPAPYRANWSRRNRK